MILADIELPVLAVYVLMAVGFIVMVWGIKNMSTKPNARIIMIVGAILVFGSVIASLFVSGDKSEGARLDRNIRVFQTAKAEKAASYIADRFPEEGSVAFLIDDESNNSGFANFFILQELQARLSEKGIACDDVIVVGELTTDKKTGEEFREDPTDATIMKKKLDQIYDKVDIVVNFAGLPSSTSELKKISFLTKKNNATKKNNMLLMTDNGLPYVEQDMLKSGRVCAIIDYNSSVGAAFNMQKDTAPKDLFEAFDYYFYFINPETLESYISENPNYFITK